MTKNAITDGVDLPDQLIPACVHYSLAHFLFLDGQMQMGSGHYGLAEKIEKEFIKIQRNIWREQRRIYRAFKTAEKFGLSFYDIKKQLKESVTS